MKKLGLLVVLIIAVGCGKTDKAPEKPGASDTVQNENYEEANSPTPVEDFEKSPQDIEEIVSGDGLSVVTLDKSWSSIGQYSEGLCPVQDAENGLWGYVDKTGEYIIEPQFYDAYPFSEGLAAVKDITGLYGFINKSGDIELPNAYYYVSWRFKNELAGFHDGFSVVMDTEDTYALIDTQGNVVKELGEHNNGIGHDIDRGLIVKKDGKFYHYPTTNYIKAIYDTQYNTLLTREDLARYGDRDNRTLYNYSESYFVFNDRGGKGLYIADNEGNIVFEQSMVPGMDNSDSYSVGVTDDYVVVQRSVNNVRVMAAFDFEGNMVLDYKYPKIIPFAKGVFAVQNNAGTIGVVDDQDNELLPFSMEVTSIQRNKGLDGLSNGDAGKYEHIKNLGGFSFETIDENEDKKAHYFDFASKQIKDIFFVEYPQVNTLINAFDYEYTMNTGDFLYCCDFPCFEHNDTEAIIYNEAGEEILKVHPYVIPIFIKGELFIKEGVIPIENSEGDGVTFAIIQ